MQIEQHTTEISAFTKLGFSQKVARCIQRSNEFEASISSSTLEEIIPIIDIARKTTRLASERMIGAMYARNPDILRLCRSSDGKPKGFLAYLPLNEVGFNALVKGDFDGMAPRSEWICPSGVVPEAIYLWMVFMPGCLASAISVIGGAFNELAPQGCAVFSRAVNPHAERLNRTMGFLDAKCFYPDCRPGLLVVFPLSKQLPATNRASSTINVARGWDEMAQVMSIRASTYIAEQFCYYSEEFDGNDFCATHLLGKVGDDAAGCVRIRFFADFAKIERLAVRSEYRNSRLSFELVRAAIRHCGLKGYRRIYGHSRLDLVRFWKIFGFKERVDREEFAFANVRYCEMILDQDRVTEAITLNSSPFILIRPEGAWDLPGPLDLSLSAADPRRAKMMVRRTRTLAGLEISNS